MDYDDDEVFYLSKEDGNTIFISRKQTFMLKSHQHRGLRFLYRQYKMKKPGVIMNDASGFGKKVQTAVFLDAIKHTLSQPALILCNETERDNWKYYFMHFGRDYKEFLSFDASLPSADKKIFIRSFDDIEAVIKKSWSIVVVDDPVAIKLFKPLKNLKADFRIWVVSIELKYNLNTFGAINDWVNPRNTFSVKDFTPKDQTVSEVIQKAVLLDRYFEELVLSRGHEDKVDKKKQPLKIKVSTVKKNKDSIGTKIKKSKRKALSQDIQNKSEQATNNAEDEMFAKSSNDSIDYELNTIPMEVENNVINESNEITGDDENSTNNDEVSRNSNDEKSGIEINKLEKTETATNKIEIINAQIKSTASETDSIIDTKLRDLEEKTFAQFKGSFLDQLLGTNKPSKSISSNSYSDKIVKKSDELVMKSDEAITKVVGTDKLATPVKVANQSPSKSSPQKIDDQIKELEQKTYDKFKGSLLDQLF